VHPTGAIPTKPGSATRPFPGIITEIVDLDGKTLPAAAEAAIVGKPDEIKGEEIVAFVTLNSNFIGDANLVKELQKHVGVEIGAIDRPGEIRFTDALPKTRSGKIMRRLLRDLAAGKDVSGDTSTLEDRSVLDKLRGSD
jgi:acetyl-CoA synthetase